MCNAASLYFTRSQHRILCMRGNRPPPTTHTHTHSVQLTKGRFSEFTVNHSWLDCASLYALPWGGRGRKNCTSIHSVTPNTHSNTLTQQHLYTYNRSVAAIGDRRSTASEAPDYSPRKFREPEGKVLPAGGGRAWGQPRDRTTIIIRATKRRDTTTTKKNNEQTETFDDR